MKKWINNIVTILLLIFTTPLMAKISVFACEPEWQSLADELGGERITSFSATTAYQDPHRIEARPSLIAKLRRADLLICSGAELETGWLPQLQRQAANARVLPDQPGYFETSAEVERLDIPVLIDRSLGDVHAAGNPHVHLDPRRISIIATALSKRLSAIDPDGVRYYERRLQDFEQRWQLAITQWQQRALPLKGVNVVVHHKDWVYLFDWLGMNSIGALEPRPGLPTTVGHLAELKQQLSKKPASMIIHTTYQSPRAAQRLSQLTSIPVLQLPYTVGGAEQVRDLFTLFDVTINLLLDAMQ